MANVKIKVFAVGFAGALALSAFAGSAMAAKPENPGCFGRDRAAWLHANSGAEWGVIAGERAGDNGQINRDYRAGVYAGPESVTCLPSGD